MLKKYNIFFKNYKTLRHEVYTILVILYECITSWTKYRYRA